MRFDRNDKSLQSIQFRGSSVADLHQDIGRQILESNNGIVLGWSSSRCNIISTKYLLLRSVCEIQVSLHVMYLQGLSPLSPSQLFRADLCAYNHFSPSVPKQQGYTAWQMPIQQSLSSYHLIPQFSHCMLWSSSATTSSLAALQQLIVSISLRFSSWSQNWLLLPPDVLCLFIKADTVKGQNVFEKAVLVGQVRTRTENVRARLRRCRNNGYSRLCGW